MLYSGSAIALGPQIGPIFQQLGIWDEFVTAGKMMTALKVLDEDLEPLYSMEYEWLESK